MRTVKLNQKGIGHIALVFVVVFLAVVGFAGYKILSKNSDSGNTASSVTLTPKVPEKISTKADLETASKALDNSSTQVNSNLNDASLDADLNDLL